MKDPVKPNFRKKLSTILLITVLGISGLVGQSRADSLVHTHPYAISKNLQYLPQNVEPLAPLSIMHRKFDYLKVYHDKLGFFCKAENKASKNAPVQLRMRLGSLDYVDKLEGK